MDIVDGKELATLPSGASFTPSFRTESPKPPSVRISAAAGALCPVAAAAPAL